MVDDLVEYRGLWLAPFVMLEFLFLTLPCVSPEHRRSNRGEGATSCVNESERDSECHTFISRTYIASEVAELIAQNVRREVASSLLAQANLQGDIVLKLIRG